MQFNDVHPHKNVHAVYDAAPVCAEVYMWLMLFNEVMVHSSCLDQIFFFCSVFSPLKKNNNKKAHGFYDVYIDLPRFCRIPGKMV